MTSPLYDPSDPQGSITKMAEMEASLASLREMLAAEHNLPPHPLPPSEPSQVRPVVNPIAALRALHGNEEQPLPPPPPPPPPVEPDPDELPWERPEDLDDILNAMSGWREMILRPGMAHAMLYVVLPVIQHADEYGDKGTLVADLKAWSELTITERVALTELFIWLEQEMVNPESAIPQHLRANMERAQAGYDASAP